jgi:hypothetical protein
MGGGNAVALPAFFPIVDQTAFVRAEVRPELGQTLSNLVGGRSPGPSNHHVDVDAVVQATQSDPSTVQVSVPELPSRPVQVGPVAPEPEAEIVEVREVEEAPSDSVELPHDVKPVQDVFFSRVEPLTHNRTDAVLPVAEYANLRARAAPVSLK